MEKPAEAPPPYSNGAAAKYGGWANVSERDKKVKVHSLLAYGYYSAIPLTVPLFI